VRTFVIASLSVLAPAMAAGALLPFALHARHRRAALVIPAAVVAAWAAAALMLAAVMLS
jgi:hypothetical protein